MSTLFGRDKSTISRHIKNIFEEREPTIANYATVQEEGNREVLRDKKPYPSDFRDISWRKRGIPGGGNKETLMTEGQTGTR